MSELIKIDNFTSFTNVRNIKPSDINNEVIAAVRGLDEKTQLEPFIRASIYDVNYKSNNIRGSSLEKSVYPQPIDYQKKHAEFSAYAEAFTSSMLKSNNFYLPHCNML
jgi:hypothetical protein